MLCTNCATLTFPSWRNLRPTMRLQVPGWERIHALSCATCGVPIYHSTLPDSLRSKFIELDRFGLGINGIPLLEPAGTAVLESLEEDNPSDLIPPPSQP